MTLLEKAKATHSGAKRSTTISSEHIELAIAWARDEINFRQVLIAVFDNPKANTQGYVLVARALREAFRQGLVKPTTAKRKR